ncbi:unannotated protein [freshwater metagenome]|uniref:Unannotated protein n=1 Tax=freshwater metagenome TaxID=449393 RepID=A0A6J6W192_9ZZZZ
MNVRSVANGVVNTQKIIKESIPIRVAKIAASLLFKTPVTNGRLDVRAISRSKSLSIIMLKAFAEPAANVPPIIAARVTPSGGKDLLAKTIAGNVEIRSSSTTLNFIKSM